ncbi:hypothetical protein [Streptomyces sp. IBSBF 2950]
MAPVHTVAVLLSVGLRVRLLVPALGGLGVALAAGVEVWHNTLRGVG